MRPAVQLIASDGIETRALRMIVCIGWGSLTCCQKALPVNGRWHNDGPDLAIEFARESRDGRITLVLCDGIPAYRTLWAELAVTTLDEAKEALRQREGIKLGNMKHSVGFWSPGRASGHDGSAAIEEWAQVRGLDGVVWTALKPRFGGEGRLPTLQEVIGHLSGLDGDQRECAEEYVRLAPRQITTPYRTARRLSAGLRWASFS
jgi:hypothetical protein